MNHPLTVIAQTLASQISGIALMTRHVGENVAEWVENEARAMTPTDERVAGYLDLASRLRNH